MKKLLIAMFLMVVFVAGCANTGYYNTQRGAAIGAGLGALAGQAIGRDTEWEKVKEIYKMGLKHGMKLASISGVNGVYSDEQIAEIVKNAKKALKTWKGSSKK